MDHESMLRLGMFLGVLILVAGWEFAAPRRGRALSRQARWPANLTLVVINTLLARIVFPMTAVGLAALGQARGWGLLNQFDAPAGVELLLAVIILDLVIYLQHVTFHALPALWRLHMVHHADLDLDVTTGLRFHPLEILISMAIKLTAVHAIGASPEAVVVFEVVLNAMAMFNHGNIRLPESLDQVLRMMVVTPDMHRSHHSHLAAETNMNFGFNLSWWDRALGTYCPRPAEGHEAMIIGLEHQREPERCQPLLVLLLMPFRSLLGEYPINRRW